MLYLCLLNLLDLLSTWIQDNAMSDIKYKLASSTDCLLIGTQTTSTKLL